MMLNGKTAIAGLIAFASMASLSACTSQGVSQAQVHKGTVPLEAIRVGTPERIFKEAIMTFIPDTGGTFGGKNQYLSRMKDGNGGQLVVQAKDDLCYEVSVVHTTPINKETGLQTIQRLAPANVKEELVLVGTEGATPVETYQLGKNYVAQVIYTDKAKKDVSVVSLKFTGPSPSEVASQGQAQ